MSDALIIAAPLAVLAACSVYRLARELTRSHRSRRDRVEHEQRLAAMELLREDAVELFEIAEKNVEAMPITPEARERWLQWRFGADQLPLFRALAHPRRNPAASQPGAGGSPADREPGHG